MNKLQENLLRNLGLELEQEFEYNGATFKFTYLDDYLLLEFRKNNEWVPSSDTLGYMINRTEEIHPIKNKSSVRMSKELEALQYLYDSKILNYKADDEYYLEQLEVVKKELIEKQKQDRIVKAFEIIKEKQVDVNLFITIIPFNKSIEKLAKTYNQCFVVKYNLTTEETRLLKEVLCDE